MLVAEQDCEYLNNLINCSVELIAVINKAGLFTFANSALSTNLGYTSNEFINSSFLNYLHPEDQLLGKTLFEALVAVPSIKMPAFRFKAKSGEWRLLETSISNQLQQQNINGFIVNVRDVTDIQESDVYSLQNQAFYQSLFYNHPDAVFALTPDGIFIHSNASASKITGYASGQLIGCHFSQIVPARQLDKLVNAFATALKGEACTVEGKILKNHAIAGDFLITLVPVIIDHKVVSIQGIAKEITAIRRANELVSDYASQLHNIMESMTDAFCEIDASGNLTFFNSVFAQYFKSYEGTLKGNNIWELQPALLATEFYKACVAVFEKGKSLNVSEYIDAFKAYLNFTVYATKNGLAVCFSDVTEQKKAQQELVQLAMVASKTTNGVIITNAEGETEWVNEGFTRLTGYTFNEVAGHKPGCLLQGFNTDQDVVEEMRMALFSNKPFTTEVLNYTKSGDELWVRLEVTPVQTTEESVVRYMAILSDITAHKNAESYLLQLTDSLYKQNQELQQFSYIVSHNLHSPVANAKGLTNMLRRVQPGSSDFSKALQNMEQTIENLSVVINDLTSILAVNTSEKPATSIHVASVVQETLQTIQDSILLSSADIDLQLDQTIKLQGNKVYLSSIIQNLVTNAIKFRHANRKPELTISATKLNSKIILSVKDNGLGMDLAKVQSGLFKLYKRFHPDKEGRGLGLYMVKTQVEALGGTIDVNSKPGLGTIFTLTFNDTKSDV